jgi:hypothetical protein
MPNSSTTTRSQLLRVVALVAFSLTFLLALALIAFVNPAPSRWCIDGNGCMFYTDNLWVTWWLGLPAIGIGAISVFGARWAWRGSKLAIACGVALMLLLAPVAWILFMLMSSKWQ